MTRGFLGVSIQDVTRDIADSVGLDTARGALVTQLNDDSPGAKAGLKSGDIITRRRWRRRSTTRSRPVAHHRQQGPGTTVELTIWRDRRRDQADARRSARSTTSSKPAEPEQPAQPDEPAAPDRRPASA